MMPRANGNTQFIEQHTHIVVVYPVHQKRNNRTFMFRSTEYTHTFYVLQSIGRITQQFVFMSGNRFQSYMIDIIQSRRKSARPHIVRCTGLELERQLPESRTRKST